uniref:(California timema) hypothetical protein n=1 Tax=Timema californicum TaxID=61474 RepID=A0A7R9J8B2_TIMCA|nr:unnamed protein product [Timema californicum]
MAIIYTFNVKIPDKLEALAKSKQVVIKQHNIIYRLVDDLKTEINSRLPLKPVEEILVSSYFMLVAKRPGWILIPWLSCPGVQLVDPDDRFSAVDARAVNPSPQTPWSFLVFSSPAALRPSS